MVHSTNVLTYGLSKNNKKIDGFLRLIVFTIVKIMSTDKEIIYKVQFFVMVKNQMQDDACVY
jgi:hypothetical protein